jgi:cytochrome b6-f complex iron-sulfur subunit
MNRREFITWVGVGSIASSLPLALAACSPKTTESSSEPQSQSSSQSQSSASPSRADGFQSVGKVEELKQKGQILNDKFPAGSILVVSNPANSKTITAVNPICPHRGCTVEWKAAQKAFVCPCHNAQFSTSGKVLKGPADKPLSTYEAKVEGDSILAKKA